MSKECCVIPRYTRPAMGRIWTDEHKYRCWLRVELAATAVLAQAGIVPRKAASTLIRKADFDIKRIHTIEAQVKHDVIAFTTAVAEKAGPEARWLHYGLTSNDVVDTAQALQLAEANAILHEDIESLIAVLHKRAHEFKHTPMIGRTHGIHAEPITFGLKLANWYSEMQRNLTRFTAAAEDLRVGKLSGAVGTLAHLDPKHEEAICAKLGLKPAAVSSQVIQRDRHAQYLSTLAVTAATLEKIALEVRHLQRTEVREVEERFGSGQKGSSAMPHKRNPVTSEQICGLARLVRTNALAALENVALWHERDISHSSVERIILPDSTILLDYMLDKTTRLIADLAVDEARMLANLESTGGLVFSGQLLLDLAEAGLSRENAYKVVQEHAMKAWKEGASFRNRVAHDPVILTHLTQKQLESAFDLKRQLRNVNAIFARVFGKAKRSKR